MNFGFLMAGMPSLPGPPLISSFRSIDFLDVSVFQSPLLNCCAGSISAESKKKARNRGRKHLLDVTFAAACGELRKLRTSQSTRSPSLEAFGRDVDFHDNYPQSVYLDLQRGDLLWLYDDDEDACAEAGISPEDNAADLQLVSSFPDRHLEIPGLDHGDHHEILRECLDSDWTDDDDARLKAREAYFGSNRRLEGDGRR